MDGDRSMAFAVPPGNLPASTVAVTVETDAATIPIEGGFTYLNDAPVAAAHPLGSRYEVFAGDAMVLDASASLDPNDVVGDAVVRYEWDLDGDGLYDRVGVQVQLDAEELKSYGIALDSETLVQLRITDSHGAQSTDSAEIVVLPIADAFPNVRYADWSGDADADGIDDRLDAFAADERVDIVVTFVAGTDLDAVAARLEAISSGPPLKIPAVTSLCLRGVRAADVSDVLRNEPELFRVEQEEVIEASLDISAATLQVGASAEYSPATTSDAGVFGAGINIAFIDSGIDDDHPAFAGKFVAGFDAFTDIPLFSGSQSNPDDDMDFAAIFHGTHSAGIALGAEPPFVGVAPAAKLVDVKVLGGSGQGSTATVLAGLQWCIQHKSYAWAGQPSEHYGIDVINMSLNGKTRSDGSDVISMMVDAAVAAGIVVITSAGNTSSLGVGFGAPAAASGSITVGAVDDQGTVDRSDVAAYLPSNFGPRSGNGDSDVIDELKPDVVAPGVDIRAPTGNVDPLPASGFSALTGSSMAAAHVAGVAALMLEVSGGLSPRRVKELLRKTAEPLGAPSHPALDPSWNPRFGKGLVNAYRALPQSTGVMDGVWVASAQLDELTVVLPDPTAPPSSTQPLGAPYSIGGARGPVGIAVDGGGNVWLASRENGTVSKSSSAGSLLFRRDLTLLVGALVEQDLFGIAVDRNGDAWLSLAAAGAVARVFSDGGVDPTTYPVGNSPVGVAVDPDGAIWVSNSVSNDVTKLLPDGNEAVGSPFAVGVEPAGLVSDRNGRVFVANRGSDTVSMLDVDGTLLHTFAAGSRPIEIAVDFQQAVWVSNDLDNTVTRIRPSDGAVFSVGVGPGPRGISVSGDASIWVSTYTVGIGATISRLRPSGLLTEVVAVGDGPLNRGDGSGFAFANSVDPAGDMDGDGWANGEEIDSGSNPFNASLHPVELLSVTPAAGSVNGGTRVFLEGRGLELPIQVFFGGALGSGVAAVSGGLEVNAPPGAFPPASVDVLVLRPDGAASSLPAAFTYLNDPPSADAGGEYVILAGSDLLLTGSASSDPNSAVGDAIVLYEWDVAGNLFSGESVSLDSVQLAGLGLSAPGGYSVSLRVEDRLAVEAVDTTELIVVDPSSSRFVRGDSNQDRNVDLADGVFTLNWLFLDGLTPECFDAGDANGDGSLDLADPVYVFSFLFLGGRRPPEPYPSCGIVAPVLGCAASACI